MGSSKRSFAMLANTLLLGSSFPTTIGGGGEFRISVKVGNSLKLICNTNEDFSSCIFFSPQKEKFDIGTDGGEGFSNPRVHEDSNPSRTCGIHINQVTAEDEGVWRCEVQFERINGVGTANASQYVHVHGGEVVNPGDLCVEEARTDLNGNDVDKISNIPSPKACACACRDNPECSFYTWSGRGNWCFLKNSDKGRKGSHDQAHSGNKHCCKGTGHQLFPVAAVLSSTHMCIGCSGGPAKFCIDSDISTLCHSKHFADKAPWIAVRFSEPVTVTGVEFVNAKAYWDRVGPVEVKVTNTLPKDGTTMFSDGELFGNFKPGNNNRLEGNPVKGKVVLVQRLPGQYPNDVLIMEEIRVFGFTFQGSDCIEQGVDFWGNEVSNKDFQWIQNIPSAHACACACQQHHECKVFTWAANIKQCYLKTSDKGRRAAASHLYSGSKYCCNGWESGWCNDKTDKDQNSGVINLVFPGSKTTIDKCLELCKNKEGATGCEFHPHWGCSVHTNSVSGGEKDPKAKDYRCHPLSGMECQKLNVTGADYGGCNGVYAVSTQDTLQDEGRKHLPVNIKEEGDMRNHGHGSCTMLFYMHGYGWSLGPKSKVANGYYHYSGISQSKMPWEQTWKNKDIVVKCG